MTYRWFKWWTLLTLPLLVSPFIIIGMLFVEAYVEHPGRILGSVPVLILSFMLSYFSLAHLLNSTEIDIEDELDTVRHGPLPWRGCAYRLRDCEEFRADKIYEGRFTSDGVRIRFVDNSFENLCYTISREEAEEWARNLNERLFLFKKEDLSKKALD